MASLTSGILYHHKEAAGISHLTGHTANHLSTRSCEGSIPIDDPIKNAADSILPCDKIGRLSDAIGPTKPGCNREL